MSAVIIPFPGSGRASGSPAPRKARARKRAEEAPLTSKEIAAIRQIFLNCPIARRIREGMEEGA